MQTRTWSSGAYRFGFNGQEKDDEINVDGGSYDFGARILDTRLCRWLSVDPLFHKFSMLTTFCLNGNNPLIFIDKDGREIYPSNTFNNSPVKPVIDKFIADKNNPLTKKYLSQFYGSSRDLNLGYSALLNENAKFNKKGEFEITNAITSRWSNDSKSYIAFNAYSSFIYNEDQTGSGDVYDTYERNELGWAATMIHEVIYHATPNRQGHNITNSEFDDAVQAIMKYSTDILKKDLNIKDAVSLMVAGLDKSDGGKPEEMLAFAYKRYNVKLSLEDASKKAIKIGFDPKKKSGEELTEASSSLPYEHPPKSDTDALKETGTGIPLKTD